MINLANYVVWIDVTIFSLMALILIFILFLNHFYLQFLTSIIMIVFGIALFSMNFAEPVIYYKDLLKKILQIKDNKEMEVILNFIFKNKFLINLIHFTFIFTFIFWITLIIYCFSIRKKYITSFSIFAFKQNWWKIFYVPLLIIFLGSCWVSLEPLIGKRVFEKSYFNKFLNFVKVKKIFPKNEIKKELEETKQILLKIKKKNKSHSAENRINIVRLGIKLKNDLGIELTKFISNEYEKELEKTRKETDANQIWNKKNDQINDWEIFDFLEKKKNEKISIWIGKVLDSNEFWKNKDKALNSIQKTENNGILNIEKLIEEWKE